jgi:hypothetical protein
MPAHREVLGMLKEAMARRVLFEALGEMRDPL